MTGARSAVLTGKTLAGRYRIGNLLGDGGMGRVYEGVQTATGRAVAIKVLDTRRSDTEAINRFEHEARTTASLSHPNTVRVLDFGLSGGMFFIAMEYLQGIDLQDMVRGPDRSDGLVTHIMRQVASSLAEAHQKGIVHRDIKPSNIMLERFHGQPCFVKVIDFGIARNEQGKGNATVGILGTQGYMAPEYIGHGKLDVRSDLYSVGCVAYELLTGRLPYAGIDAKSTPMQALEAHLSAPAIPILERRPQTDPMLAQLVMQLLSKDPDVRPKSAVELVPRLWAMERMLKFDVADEMSTHGLGAVSLLETEQRTAAYSSFAPAAPSVMPMPEPAGPLPELTLDARTDDDFIDPDGPSKLMPAGLAPPVVTTPTPAPARATPPPADASPSTDVDGLPAPPDTTLLGPTSVPAPPASAPPIPAPHPDVVSAPPQSAPPQATPPPGPLLETSQDQPAAKVAHPPVASPRRTSTSGQAERSRTPQPSHADLSGEHDAEEWSFSGEHGRPRDTPQEAPPSAGWTWGVLLLLGCVSALGYWLFNRG